MGGLRKFTHELSSKNVPNQVTLKYQYILNDGQQYTHAFISFSIFFNFRKIYVIYFVQNN